MQITPLLFIAAAFGSAVAAPAPEPAATKDMAVAATQWTVKSFKRTCTSDKKSCSYSYSIDTKSGTPTSCSYKVSGNPAARASYNNVKCGQFTVSSNWSGQFGEGKGFQTLAVVKGKQIIYPAYTDVQLNTGKVVSPDQSYPVQQLP